MRREIIFPSDFLILYYPGLYTGVRARQGARAVAGRLIALNLTTHKIYRRISNSQHDDMGNNASDTNSQAGHYHIRS